MKQKASIIIPKYKPKKIVFNKLKKYLKENAPKNSEIIEIEGNKGLANAYNQGIKKAKGEIILTIHQDCIPLEKDSILKIIKPFEDLGVILAYSLIKEKDSGKEYYPDPPDGKFTAYRKSALEKIGLFDEENFFTGGEDADLFFKIKKLGKIVKVNTIVFHNHENYLGSKTLEKKRQNGSMNGALCRRWGFKNKRWWKAIILSIIYPQSYGKEFVKSFFSGKQDYRRKE